MNYGMKSTLPGADVNSMDIRDYSFHSGVNMLKIYSETLRQTIVPTGGSPATRDIVHNLGYKPSMLGYFKHPSNDRWHKTTGLADINTGASWGLYGNLLHVDSNIAQMRLYDSISAPMPSSPTTITNKVYILADPRENAWFDAATVDNDNASYVDDYGFKISRPGIDVLTAEPANLVFSSAMNTFKIYKIQRFDYDATRSPANPSFVEHGLDYPPTFIPIGEDPLITGHWENANNGYLNGGISPVYVDDQFLYYTGSPECYVILTIDPLDE